MRNDNINKTKALDKLLVLAKNLLCEIETAINNIGMKMPMIVTKEAMYNRLTFRNNNRDRKTSIEVDEIDSKFAKIRFIEYLHGLQQILRNRMGKRHQNIQKQKKNPPQKKVAGVKNVAAAAQHPINIPIDNNQNHNNHVKNHNFNNSYLLKKHTAHRNNKHRNRNGLGKNIRNRNQPQPTGLGLDDIKHFRRNHRKNAGSAMTLQLRTSTTSSSSTTTRTTTASPPTPTTT